MNISLTDNGGRRTEGERRLVNLDNYLIERRSHKDRRVATSDKRSKTYTTSDMPERRALDLLAREKFTLI